MQCAAAMQQAVTGLNLQRLARGVPRCELGVGIETGEVLHGFVGAQGHLEFTVISDSAGMAARFSNGAAGGAVVLGPQVYESIKHDFHVRQEMIASRNESEFAAWLLQP